MTLSNTKSDLSKAPMQIPPHIQHQVMKEKQKAANIDAKNRAKRK